MSELLFVVFETDDVAEHALHHLRTVRAEVTSNLAWAAIVRVGGGGSFSVTTTCRPSGETAFGGMFWEALLGLVLQVPVSGSAYGAKLGALFGTIDRAGIDEKFRRRARDALAPGTSAVGMLVRDEDAEPVLERLSPYEGSVLSVSLSPEDDALLEQELGDVTA